MLTWHDMLNAPAGELSVGVEFWNEFWGVKLETHELSWSSEYKTRRYVFLGCLIFPLPDLWTCTMYIMQTVKLLPDNKFTIILITKLSILKW